MSFPPSTSPPPQVLASQGTDYGKPWKAYALLSWESSLSLSAFGRLCLEVILDTWEPDPFLGHSFLIGNDLLFCIAKK